jgi:hypothetical protein
MTLIARRGQQRPDLLFEERGFFGGRLSRMRNFRQNAGGQTNRRDKAGAPDHLPRTNMNRRNSV